MTKKINLFASLRADFASGLVVFLVALPLCLGIAMASGAPLFSGILSGIVGGIVVGFLSKSHLSVSGPAAGLTAIMVTGISDLGNFTFVLTAVVIAGAIQLLLGFIRAGSISNFFPTNVIEGMLAGIGVIIILKQLPHAIGYDANFEGDQAFLESTGRNTLSSLDAALQYVHLGSILITIISLALMIAWQRVRALRELKLVPGALIAVLAGVLLNEIFIGYGSSLAVAGQHLVTLPVPENLSGFLEVLTFPDFAAMADTRVWILGVTIAIVASVETLLCIEAADRMDSHKRYTDTNAELRAQGIGNIISGLIGGLPMTSVVVRTSANHNAGAKSKMSTIIHGMLLLICVASIPAALNKIPLATLAAVLLMVGYKLTKPSVIRHFWQKGKYQFVPFAVTLLGVVFTDLLKGVALGLAVSVIFVLKGNLKRAYNFRREHYTDGDTINIHLAQEVSFLNKAAIKKTLNDIPENSKVIIDASDTIYIAHDIIDLIREFCDIRAQDDNIIVKLRGFRKAYHLENNDELPSFVTVDHPNDIMKHGNHAVKS